MKFSLLLLLLLSAGYLQAQNGFHRLFGGDEFDYGYDIVELPDSGFFVTGMTGSYTPGHAQAFLMRLDKNGNKQWIVPYGGQESDAAYDLEFDANYGTYMVGRTTSQEGDFDLWIHLLDDLGGVIWEKTYPAADWEEGVKAAMTQTNGLIVGVHRFGSNTQNQDASLICFDSQGDTLWVQEMQSPGLDEVTEIKRYQDSLFVITSNHFDPVLSRDMALLRVIHENGTEQWRDTVGIYPGNSYINDFYLQGDTMYAVGAHKFDDTSTYNRMRHMHRLSLQESGDILTGQSISSGNLIDDVVTRPHGFNFIFSAFRFQDSNGSGPYADFYLGLNNLQLTPLSQATYSNSPSGDDRVYAAIPTLDSGAVFVGYQALSTGGKAVVVMKIGAGFDYPIIPENPLVFPILNTHELIDDDGLTIYPNPASDVIYLTSAGHLIDAFRVYSINGMEMLKGKIEGSNHQISTASLSPGVYLIHCQSQGKTIGVKRLVVQ